MKLPTLKNDLPDGMGRNIAGKEGLRAAVPVI
jgi:hypothetical protein